jgi:hypothetical protein
VGTCAICREQVVVVANTLTFSALRIQLKQVEWSSGAVGGCTPANVAVLIETLLVIMIAANVAVLFESSLMMMIAASGLVGGN